MKANELRVTNLVLNDGIVNAVIMIGFDAVQLATKQGNIIQAQLDLIKPIEINEEWLLKLNFRYGNRRWKLQSLDDKILFNLSTRKLQISGYKHIRVEYVHQLQNICFALTGHELEIK